MAFRERLPGTPGEAALLLHKPTVRYQQRKITHARLTAGSKPYTYAGGCAGGCFGGKVAGSGKMVSDTPPAVAVGSSSMTITGTLALFGALWAGVLDRYGYGVKHIRYKTIQQEQEDYKYNIGSYTSSSLSELSAERSKSGSPPVRRGGGVGSLVHLAGVVAWTGKTPLQLPQRREALPRQQCLPW